MLAKLLALGCICMFAAGPLRCCATAEEPESSRSCADSGGTDGHRHLLQASAAPANQGSSPPNPAEPCYSSQPGPKGYQDMPMYMTATNKCPKDNFFVSFVIFPSEGDTVTHAAGADGTPVPGGAAYQWMGPYLMNTSDAYITVLRESDSKIITPKGINPDGSFFDISGTSRKVCQLFRQGSQPQAFAGFRALMSADGMNVIRDDFYSSKAPGSIPPGGIPCGQYVDPARGPPGTGFGAKYGQLVDVFRPGGCRFGIDECSQ